MPVSLRACFCRARRRADRCCCRRAPAAQDRVVPPSAEALRMSYAPIVKRVVPAVVTVSAAKTVANRNPLMDDPFFRRFFGPQFGGPREQTQQLARLRRHRRSVRPGRHQQPRHRRRRPGEDLARRQARVRRSMSCSRTRAPTSRCCASRTAQRALPGDRVRQFRRAAGRRRGAGDRQSVRRRPDRDPRHRLGGGAHPGRHLRLSVLHPDRRGDQSRQFRRRAGRHDRHGWSASTPRSSRARAARRASASPFPPTWCAWWWPRPAPAAPRSSGPGSAPSCRR